MLPTPDRFLGFAGDHPNGFEFGREGHRGFGPTIGLTLAATSSMMLWAGLAQAARWALHAIT